MTTQEVLKVFEFGKFGMQTALNLLQKHSLLSGKQRKDSATVVSASLHMADILQATTGFRSNPACVKQSKRIGKMLVTLEHRKHRLNFCNFKCPFWRQRTGVSLSQAPCSRVSIGKACSRRSYGSLTSYYLQCSDMLAVLGVIEPQTRLSHILHAQDQRYCRLLATASKHLFTYSAILGALFQLLTHTVLQLFSTQADRSSPSAVFARSTV